MEKFDTKAIEREIEERRMNFLKYASEHLNLNIGEQGTAVPWDTSAPTDPEPLSPTHYLASNDEEVKKPRKRKTRRDEEPSKPIFVGPAALSNGEEEEDEPTPRATESTKPRKKKTVRRRGPRFVVNTNHCRHELETVQLVLQENAWEESSAEAHVHWYGLALREHDLDVIRHGRKGWYNRYPGAEVLARKKEMCHILNRMQRLFPAEFDFSPRAFLLPEEEKDLELHMK